MKIGVTIITYNRIDFLQPCLESILNTTNKGQEIDYFIIFTDDDLLTYNFLSNYKVVKVLTNPNKLGFVKTFNKSIDKLVKSGADLIFSFNDDIVVKKSGWIEFYKRAMEKTGINHFVPMDGRNLVKRETLNEIEISYHNWVHAPIEIITKKYFNEIGGYDLRFDGIGCTDTDWCDRGNIKGLNGNVLFEFTKNMLYYKEYNWYNMGFCADVENSRDYFQDNNHYMGEENIRSYFQKEKKGRAIQVLQKKRINEGLIPNNFY